MNSPFDNVQMPPEDLFASMIIDPSLGVEPPMRRDSLATEWEPPSVQSTAIIDALMSKATDLRVSPEKQSEISQYLNFLFTPSRIVKFIGLYFEFWHPHCPFLHRGSFDSDTSTVSLLVAVVLMGAMYSQLDKELGAAKKLLDLAELFIFSMDTVDDDAEIRMSLEGFSSSTANLVSDRSSALQHLQAAYIIVTTQFWAGSLTSRRRVVETRFGVVIKVKNLLGQRKIKEKSLTLAQTARKLGLTRTRHGVDDLSDEGRWIDNESRIRYVVQKTFVAKATTDKIN